MWCDLTGDQTRLLYFETTIKRFNAGDFMFNLCFKNLDSLIQVNGALWFKV